MTRKTARLRGAPFLRRVFMQPERITPGEFPFTMPLFESGFDLELTTKTTFLVGENGTGKSTLLEAIASRCGFGSEGGSRDHRQDEPFEGLAAALKLSWAPKVADGFFLRAESFFNFAGRADQASDGSYRAYGGKALLGQSHGESFLALFLNRFHDGLFLLDEPEAALSPQRQLAFLTILHDHERTGGSQFIIATHSPMLIAYPGATVLSLDGGAVRRVDYRETEHFQLMKRFLENPELYLRHLFADDGR